MEVEKTQNEERSLNFIEQIVEKDLAEGVNNGRIQTRFPPEPNGYLHIGHVKAICMEFGIAEKYNGVCNLRFDDTNPAKEDTEYVETIERDIRWLGFKWGQIFYASDYFQQLYDLAIMFIKQGKGRSPSRKVRLPSPVWLRLTATGRSKRTCVSSRRCSAAR